MVLNIYNQYYCDESDGNILGHKMIAEKHPEIRRGQLSILWNKQCLTLATQTNKAHAVKHLYLFLKSCHSLYSLSLAPLILVRIFSSIDSRSFISDTNRWASFTSHDGWHRFRDWNKQTMQTKILQTISVTGYYLNFYFIKKARLMVLSWLSACRSPSNNFWTYRPILTKFGEHTLA